MKTISVLIMAGYLAIAGWDHASALPGMAMKIPRPCDRAAHRSPFADLLQEISIITPYEGAPDPRDTYEQVAEHYRTAGGEQLTVDEVYAKFLATGRMYCKDKGKWVSSSANLVEKGDVAVLTAHQFYDEKCEPRVTGTDDFTSCKFQTNPRPPQKPATYHVKSVQTGTKCPYADKDKNDWAVVKLGEVVEGATPYKLRESCNVKVGWSGANVAAKSKNFKDGKTPSVNRLCGAVDPDSDVTNGSFRFNCSSEEGGSGSALLCDANRQPPSIGGILIATTYDSTYDFKPYDFDNNHDIGIPFSDEIKAAIRAASK